MIHSIHEIYYMKYTSLLLHCQEAFLGFFRCVCGGEAHTEGLGRTM
jgi:hypothetical protein